MASRGNRAQLGCLAALAVPAVFIASVFLACGFDGVMVLSSGRNPFSYVGPTPAGGVETQARAERVIAALDRWKSRHGEFPVTLTELVPSELTELPRPTVGDRRWNYKRTSPGSFVLDFFEGPIYEHTWWDSAQGKWNGDH